MAKKGNLESQISHFGEIEGFWRFCNLLILLEPTGGIEPPTY